MTPEQKEKVRTVFAGTVKRVVTIGDTAHVSIGQPEEMAAANAKMDAMIKKALDRGQTVTENGVSQWIEKIAFFNPRPTLASERYRWHADGNRVKAAKYLVTKRADGSIRKKRIGFGWVTP